MSKPKSNSHILIFPYPAQGHMLPLLDLSHELHIRGVTITILITPKNLPILNTLLTTHPTINTLILPFPKTHLIPQGIENVQYLPPGSFRAMMHAIAMLNDPIVEWFGRQSFPPTAIVSDFFLGWTQSLARKLGIPRVVFSPSGAMTLSVLAVLWRDLPENEGRREDYLLEFGEVPSRPVYQWWQVSPIYRTYKKGDSELEFLRDGFLANLEGFGMVFNTFDGLEKVYLDFIRKNFGVKRVLGVGPLRPVKSNDGDERGGLNAVVAGDVRLWLDTCPDHSVVYVCFGSQVVLSNKQMEELAKGLELSGTRFIWCVKEPTGGHKEGEFGIVPEGFEDRTKGRGMVIRGWAPQVLILSHRAIATFLTHCGWNSVLESLTAGVPMLAWPMGADQFVNATLLVEHIGIATRVCEGRGTVPNADEFTKELTESVGEKNATKRARAVELSKAALATVEKGGNSYKSLDTLIQELDLELTISASKNNDR